MPSPEASRWRTCFLIAALALAVPAAAQTPAPGASAGAEADALGELDCIIEPSEVVDVGAAVPGVLERVYAERADIVERGAVLAELESGFERVSVDLAQLRAQLTTDIELRKESAEFGVRTHTRNEALVANNIISRQDMDRLHTERRVAELQLRQAYDNERLEALELARARELLDRRTIRSPIDGVVMERFRSPGEHVEDDAVMRIAKLDPLHVEVIVPVDYIHRIQPGQRAEVAPQPGTWDRQVATVVRVDRVANPASGTFGVRLALPNPDYRIPGGLRCRVAFLDEYELAENTRGPRIIHAPGHEAPGEAAAPTPDPDPGPAARATVAGTPSTAAPACFGIGPLPGRSVAQELETRLSAAADTSWLHVTSRAAWRRYLVLAKAEPTDETGVRDVVARLKDKGFRDAALLRDGDAVGRVSLGAFDDEERARARLAAVQESGVAVEVIPRDTGEAWWLELGLADRPGVEGQLRSALADAAPAARLTPVECPALLAAR